MKTLQDLYNEIMGNDDLKKEFVGAMKNDGIKAFLEAQGCDASLEEVDEFLKGKASEKGSLKISEDELSKIAGGTWVPDTMNHPMSQSQTCFLECC